MLDPLTMKCRRSKLLPKQGHLLVMKNFNSFKLNHGLMEVGYVGHQDSTFKPKKFDAKTSSISMTATMDSLGNLILVPDGKPMIRLVPGLSNVFIAACHKGERLTLDINSKSCRQNYEFWSEFLGMLSPVSNSTSRARCYLPGRGSSIPINLFTAFALTRPVPSVKKLAVHDSEDFMAIR
nr:hypothetical protein [Tanacetum cinerariifolium]